MTAESETNWPGPLASTLFADQFDFNVASPAENAELLQFSTSADMPGAIRFSFDRSPDYFAALRVEGRHTDILVGREVKTGRMIATGQRSVKNAFVNGDSTIVSYLSGLRVEPSVRSASFLSKGYTHINALQALYPAQFHLTTIMEDNAPAQKVLLSKRFGLPIYHDLGRYCCMALSLKTKTRERSIFLLRRASATDAVQILDFLNCEGRTRQFFPEYCAKDFNNPIGLLPHLSWEDVFLAFDGPVLLGMLAAWDQQAFRRWSITGFTPWLRSFRHLINLAAKLRRMPSLPPSGTTLNCFNLSLVCIRDNNHDVFNALLDEVLRIHRNRYTCFLAGLHERDPLLPELLIRPHVSLNSRLYLVDWEKEEHTLRNLDARVPYLELGSL